MRWMILCALTMTSAFAAEPVRVPAVTTEGVVNAASYESGMVSPGEIIVIFGSDLGPAELRTLEVAGGRVTSTLSGVTITFDGVPAPLIYVSGGQSSAIVPYSVGSALTTEMRVESNGVVSGPISIPVTAAVPGLFSADSSGSGQGAILNQDGSVNSADNPADVGEVIVLFGTGEGQTDPMGQDGLLAVGPTLPSPQLPVRVEIAGVAQELLYAGAAPQLVAGVIQVNIRARPEESSLEVPLDFRVGAARAFNRVTAAVVAQLNALAPGDTDVVLTGVDGQFHPDLAGTVERDELVPFEIKDAAGMTVLAGMIQDRVVLSQLTGRFLFNPRLRDMNDFGSGARVVAFDKNGFAGKELDVEFEGASSDVEFGPARASRSEDGDVVRFTFDPTLGADQESIAVVMRSETFGFLPNATMNVHVVMPDGAMLMGTVEDTFGPE